MNHSKRFVVGLIPQGMCWAWVRKRLNYASFVLFLPSTLSAIIAKFFFSFQLFALSITWQKVTTHTEFTSMLIHRAGLSGMGEVGRAFTCSRKGNTLPGIRSEAEWPVQAPYFLSRQYVLWPQMITARYANKYITQNACVSGYILTKTVCCWQSCNFIHKSKLQSSIH